MSASERNKSLLQQQMAILGYAGGPMDPATRREKERMASLPLPPLHLPGASEKPAMRLGRSRRWQQALGFGALIGAFAALLLFVYRGDLPWSSEVSNDRLRVKGESKIWVYWERQGEVRQLEPGTSLKNGDRVRAEVLAAEDVVGYLAVRGENGALLWEPSQVRDGSLRLKAGQKGTFSGSVKLVGEDEGEKLLVVICGTNVTFDFGAVFPGERQPVDLTALPGGCSAQEFPLR